MLPFLDKNWRRKNLYYIVNKDSSRVLFRQNAIQRKVYQSTTRLKLILKARQFGISTEGIIDDLDHTMFTRNTTTVILAHEQDAIEKLFRIARRAYEFMPDAAKPRLDKGGGSKYEMYFPDINSRIYCDLESRGDTIHRLHVSEAAFMKDPNRLKATMQAVPSSGKIRIESTPNGIGNYFYELWNDSEVQADKMFFPWFFHDEYQMPADPSIEYSEDELMLIRKAKDRYNITVRPEQIQWRRWKKQELKSYSTADKVSFEQEYPEDDTTCFVTSGKMVFDGLVIKRLLTMAPRPIRWEDNCAIYEMPDKTDRYIIGADCAEGSGGDYSTACCVSLKTKKVVATFRGHVRDFEFADILNELGKMYSSTTQTPMIAVERNNHGHAVILQLNHHHGYPNLYIHTDDKLGWHTTALTRPNLLNTFVEAVEEEVFQIQDKATLEECLTLINNDGKLEAASGKHDDCIIAAAIAIKLSLEAGDIDLYQNLRTRIRI